MADSSLRTIILHGNHKNLFVLVALIFVLCALTFSVASGLAESEAESYTITLNDNSIIADFPGIYTEGSIVTITLPGNYILTGSLSNGQIIVDLEQDGKVKLFFNGVSVHCENGPALYIKKCSPRLSIDIIADTVNELSDGTVYADESGKVDAVIYSKGDLTITGEGNLNITGSYKHGIVSKDDLRIKGGKINVQAVKNGICGKDCVEIFDGSIVVRAGNDGIKTTNEDSKWGYISIEGGTVKITCGDDPLSVVHGLSIIGGSVSAEIDASLKSSDD